jgi:hypothetical protein
LCNRHVRIRGQLHASDLATPQMLRSRRVVDSTLRIEFAVGRVEPALKAANIVWRCGIGPHRESRLPERPPQRHRTRFNLTHKAASHRPRRPASNPVARFQTQRDGLTMNSNVRASLSHATSTVADGRGAVQLVLVRLFIWRDQLTAGYRSHRLFIAYDPASTIASENRSTLTAPILAASRRFRQPTSSNETGLRPKPVSHVRIMPGHQVRVLRRVMLDALNGALGTQIACCPGRCTTDCRSRKPQPNQPSMQTDVAPRREPKANLRSAGAICWRHRRRIKGRPVVIRSVWYCS